MSELIEKAGILGYGVEGAAEELKVHPQTIREYINQGRLKATLIGRKWFISQDNLQKFVKGEEQADINGIIKKEQ